MDIIFRAFCISDNLFKEEYGFSLPVTSSGALKKGYVRDKTHSMITPHAHMSTAVV